MFGVLFRVQVHVHSILHSQVLNPSSSSHIHKTQIRNSNSGRLVPKLPFHSNSGPFLIQYFSLPLDSCRPMFSSQQGDLPMPDRWMPLQKSPLNQKQTNHLKPATSTPQSWIPDHWRLGNNCKRSSISLMLNRPNLSGVWIWVEAGPFFFKEISASLWIPAGDQCLPDLRKEITKRVVSSDETHWSGTSYH